MSTNGITWTRCLTSELRKTTSTPAWWIIGLAMVLCSVGFSMITLFGAMAADSPNLRVGELETMAAFYTVPSSIALIFTLVLGVLGATDELRTRTIGQTLLAVPNRLTVYSAKLVAAVLVSAGFAVLSLLAVIGAVAGAAAAQGHAHHLGDPAIWARIGGSLAVLLLWAAIGAGLGALVRSQLITVIAVLLLTQVIEPMLRVLAGDAGDYLPGALADQAAGGTLISMAMGQDGLSQPAALGLFTALAAVVAGLGALRFRRTEIE